MNNHDKMGAHDGHEGAGARSVLYGLVSYTIALVAIESVMSFAGVGDRVMASAGLTGLKGVWAGQAFLAAVLASCISRRNMTVWVVTLTIVLYVLVITLLTDISLGQSSWIGVALKNLDALLMSVLAIVAGSAVGARLSSKTSGA